MVLWQTQIKYTDRDSEKIGIKHLTVPKDSQHAGSDWDSVIKELNKRLGGRCDPNNRISIYIYDGREGCLDAIISYPIKDSSLEYCLDFIKELLEKEYSACDIDFDECTEISSKRFDYLGNSADDKGYIRRWHVERMNLGLDYFSNRTFKVEEYIENDEFTSLEEACKAGSAIMADKSLTDELTRIYSDENEKKYYGNPVHYRISASSTKVAMDIIEIMVPALIANKRLCGKRILRLYDIGEGCYDESELDHLFESAQGNTLILETAGTNEDHGNYASAYQRVVDNFDQLIERNHLNTLCIFVEIKGNEGFSKSLISKVEEKLRIVDIFEGYGDREQAGTYLKTLIERENFSITDQELGSLLEEKKMFSVEEINDIYGQWFKNGLCTHIYKAYQYCENLCEKLDERSSEPYDELQKMIGLTEIKQTVDQIIDSARIRKIKTDMGMDTHKTSLHMVFTGNPGSAKTTVARLIAQILRKEDILEGGSFVECGRADLIAKYVGWTAKQVRAKVREARGGILFIDEAYSLVEDRYSFADEAINTLVQEMENHRDDLIVIFAGYPDKMKAFLSKNEGLKSRISFHLDFPDYTPDELTEILELMADQHGYKLTGDVIEKCRHLFESACKEEDFGNGRYVRNLLEQAELAQSYRLISMHPDGKIGKRELQRLCAVDFDVNISAKTADKSRNPIGFAM